MTTIIKTDIAIIGGGIAGLWLLNRLRNAGYHAVLFEADALGSAQTIASQGMIHGGIKYALSGTLSGASEAIAGMPDHWRRCLAGNGDVDLRQTTPLSDNFYLWSTASLASKLSSFFASKLTRGRVNNVKKSDGPAVFNHADFRGHLYQLVDLVLDVPNLVANLFNNYADSIYAIDWQQASLTRNSHGEIASLKINNELTLNAQRFIFTAGEGNEALLKKLDLSAPEMQRRPLKQALVKHQAPYSLYAHCMGLNPSPRLTISSHRANDGAWVWYLGGDLATENTHASDGELIDAAKKELHALFPWVDFGHCEWSTLFLNRAEPKQSSLLKPDQAFAERADGCNNLIVGWPTKLTLAPDMANRVMDLLNADAIKPQATENLDLLTAAKKPAIAKPAWETAF